MVTIILGILAAVAVPRYMGAVSNSEAAAEAEALRLVSEQIAANPNLIQYTYITELAQNVSLIMVPSNSPFLFDASSFTDLGDDFEAPASEPMTAPETSNDG